MPIHGIHGQRSVEEKLQNALIDAVLMDVKDASVKPSMLLQCFGFRTDICIIRVVRNHLKDNTKITLVPAGDLQDNAFDQYVLSANQTVMLQAALGVEEQVKCVFLLT